jgi:hypothetical protein
MSGLDSPTSGATMPQDEHSALVEREWTRIVGERRGTLTERPMIGQEVTATFLDPHGGLHHVSGTVRRNEAGELVINSANGSETAIPRDANVDPTRGR